MVSQGYRDHFYDPNSGAAEAYLLKLENEAWADLDPPELYLTDILQDGMWSEEDESYALPIGANNSLLQSDDYNNAAWIKADILAFGAGSVANTGETPDPEGGNTADKIVPTAGASANHTLQQNVAIAPNQMLTYGAWVKYQAGGPQWLRLLMYDTGASGNQVACYFDILNGVVGNAPNIGNGRQARGEIVSRHDGWKLLILHGKPNTSGTQTTVRITASGGNGVGSFTGNGVNGWYSWRSQIEAGDTLHQPLQKTEGAAVFNMIVYWWAPFEIVEPNMSDDEPRGSIALPNVLNTEDPPSEVGARLALLTTPIKLTINVVLKSDPTHNLVDPIVLMDITAIRGNRSTISGDIGWPKLTTEPMPWEIIGPDEFRCAFRTIT